MYQNKLQELRSRWKQEPDNRKIIEVQAKLLLMAQELENKNSAEIEKVPEKELTPDVIDDIFG